LVGLGAYAVPGSLTLAAPGADAHAAGTLPMGGAGPAGTDLAGAVAGLPGVHVVDGAALSDLPARHCTLTIMANADRIARLLAAG
jgi:choline dehydrogenase-like flavoprotein